jgi:hypothetical protein
MVCCRKDSVSFQSMILAVDMFEVSHYQEEFLDALALAKHLWIIIVANRSPEYGEIQDQKVAPGRTFGKRIHSPASYRGMHDANPRRILKTKCLLCMVSFSS